MPPKITKTTNRLHFSDLDPMRFEDLCLELVNRLGNWKNLSHYGRAGKEGGIDIYGIQENQNCWAVQCKRYARINKTELKKIAEDVIKNDTKVDKLLLIISTDLSRSLNDFFSQSCIQAGIKESEIWTASILETKLFEKNTDLLNKYFGIGSSGKKSMSNASKIKYSLKMQKKMYKDFINHRLLEDRDNWAKITYDPSIKFINEAVIIRSVDDNTYPNFEIVSRNDISSWFKTYLYDFYHNGIEVWLNAGIGGKIIVDNQGQWEFLEDYYDNRQNDLTYRVFQVKEIGRIPFYNIVDYMIEPDQFTDEPHIFCHFDFNGTPYERIYYKLAGNPKEKKIDLELDDKKRTYFPKF